MELYSKTSELTPDCCSRALRRMPTISGPGLNGLRASHLRTILSASYDERTFATVLSKISNGQSPDWMRNCRLIAISKPNGGVRPIAIGEVLRRLSASTLNEQFLRSTDVTPANQLALINDGSLLGSYVIAQCLTEGLSVANLDTTNVFNCVLRNAIIESTKNTLLEKYVNWAYCRHSEMHLDNERKILSKRGVKQVDPLGMTLFCLAISNALDNFRAIHKEHALLHMPTICFSSEKRFI